MLCKNKAINPYINYRSFLSYLKNIDNNKKNNKKNTMNAKKEKEFLLIWSLRYMSLILKLKQKSIENAIRKVLHVTE